MRRSLLSICIPTYNRAQIVYDCVCNCLNIPYDWIEIVVTDNGSSDNTQQLLKTINDPRFKYFRNEINIGYINLTKCLMNGSGLYCLLLSDEDDFYDVDWLLVKKQLESNNGVSVFQFTYMDEDETLLVQPPNHLYFANDLKTFKKIFRAFPYAGGVVIQKDVLKISWEENYSFGFLWSLYNEIIIPLYCAKYGNYHCLTNLSVKRGKRNNTGVLDTKAVCGTETEEPYWSISSRRLQMKEWILFFSKFDVNDENIRMEMAKLVIQDSIDAFRNYHTIIFGNVDAPLFRKHKAIIDRDKRLYKYRWIRESIVLYSEVGKEFNNFFGRRYRNRISEMIGLARVIKYFVKQYICGCT